MRLWFSNLFEQSNAFIPHGHCFLWLPGLLWLHVVSDTLIGMAYLGISLALYLLVRKIRLPFSPLIIAFGLFIGLCGLTHFMAVWTVWNPDYWLSGLVKAATAAASVATAIGLFYVKPQVEALVHTARLSEERRIQLETANAELEALYQKTKELDELKTQFFSNVSHELRTPLALIMGPAERMSEDANLTSQQRKQLTAITRNSKSLLKQVNDLLDVARMDEGRMPINYVKLDLVAWFRRIASQFEITAEHRQMTYTIDAPEALPAEVDPDMLERVFINLLSNAFKFTPDGGAIHAQLDGDQDEIRYSVTDTGPGISASDHEVIFDRFHQTSGGAARLHGGTGLGLVIVKDFAELHHGRVEVKSELGGGAKFTVYIPSRAPASATVRETPPPSLEPATQVALEATLHEFGETAGDAADRPSPAKIDGPSVLVVEDTGEMSQFIVSILSRDYNVITAVDGQDGLEKAIALQPDLVVTDIMMPRMSGDQLVKELRNRAEFNKVPILLLTAKADDELRVKLLEAGAQDFLTKPFLPQELLARANNLIGMKRAGDSLRAELTSASGDLVALAKELAAKHRQLQTALEATSVAREQAERASQIKSHFLALISHEMRTPLATINLNSQMLSRQAPTETVSNTRLKRLMRASQQLSLLIEGLLEYTRVEGGRIAPQVEPVDILAIAGEVIDIGQLQINSPNVTLVLAPPPQPVAPLVTDPRLLRVILNNLISNAIKFTDAGTITLRIASTNSWHSFEVQDTGLGIPEEDIPRIFMPFEQLEPVHRKSIPGVGLGLALTKEIVETLGGKIEVISGTGAGSTFKVVLFNQQRG